jgi:hypothetical protein
MADIAQWLEQNGLGKYAEVFAENALTVDVLPELTSWARLRSRSGWIPSSTAR